MVRSGQPIISRPAWHDRNPAHIQLQWFNNNQAPHTATQRWTYTVPAGKKAFVEAALVYIRRSAAATTAARVQLTIGVTPSGGLDRVLLLAQILTNNIGDYDRADLGQSITLLPGDLIDADSVDDSTGGTINYNTVAKITEFDA